MFRFIRVAFLVMTTSLLIACGASGVNESENDPTANGTSSATGISSLAASSVSSVASSKTASSKAASSKAISSTGVSQSSASSSSSANQVTVQWAHPQQRENGDYLELNEIAGYEIRVFNPSTSNYTFFQIPGNSVNSYVINDYRSTMTIEIAVYDTQGLYSQFVPVTN